MKAKNFKYAELYKTHYIRYSQKQTSNTLKVFLFLVLIFKSKTVIYVVRPAFFNLTLPTIVVKITVNIVKEHICLRLVFSFSILFDQIPQLSTFSS